MKALGPKDRRALIAGIGVIVGAVILLRGIPATVRAIAGLKERTVEQVNTLARVEDVVMRGQMVRDSLSDTFREIVALAPDLVEGESAPDAQASLSALISLAANRHSMKVVRVDPLPDSAAGAFHRVALHAEFEGDLTGVTGLVGGLETGSPILTVSSLSLESPDPSPHPRASEVLHLAIDVSGYYLPRTR